MSFIGKYEVVRELAHGGMAKVFLARAAGPKGFEKRLVIKQILPHLTEDPQFVEMFLSEARTVAEFNHPNVVQIFELGESEGSYYIAMEFIDGPNLRVLSRRAQELNTPLRPPVIAQLISHACEGLAYAHEFLNQSGEAMQLVHRDVSPDNILISRSGTVKVVDFGIAKGANDGNPHHTRTGSVKGKLAYMAPEQISGVDLDRRADVYAVGVVLYELLSGLKPYRNTTSDVKLMHSILYEEIVPLAERRTDLPQTLVQIVDRALAKDRTKRYQSCRELQSDLQEFISLTGEVVTPAVLSKLVSDFAPPAPSEVTPTPRPMPRPTPGPIPAASSGANSAPVAVRPAEPEPISVELILEEATGESRPPAKERPRRRAVLGGVAAAATLLLVAAGAGVIARRDPAPAVVSLGSPVPAPAPSAPAAERAPAQVDSAVASAAAAPAESPDRPEAPARAVFAVDCPLRGAVKVNGRAVGNVPVRGIQVAPGTVKVEFVDRDSGFRKTETFRLRSGDNGTKLIQVDDGELEFRVRPYATVLLDGRSVGQTPLTVSAREGKHEITLINKDLGKQIQLSYVVKPNQVNVVKYILGE